MDDFSKLDDTRHMLNWLCPSGDPYVDIKNSLQDILAEQVKGTQIDSLVITESPQWLSGGRPDPDDEGKIILVRCAVAMALRAKLSTPSGEAHTLPAIFTWAGAGLDDPQTSRQRTWLDVQGGLPEFGSEGLLQERVYFA